MDYREYIFKVNVLKLFSSVVKYLIINGFLRIGFCWNFVCFLYNCCYYLCLLLFSFKALLDCKRCSLSCDHEFMTTPLKR